MPVRILIDRDRTNRARRGAADAPDIIAVFQATRRGASPFVEPGSPAARRLERLSSPTLYRVVDLRELRDIVRTGKVRGGLFATPSERKHGASWANDPTKVAVWGRGWRGRLGAELFVLELDAVGKAFYHMGPTTRPPFDPFGPAHQPATMSLTECETGLGCSVSPVVLREVKVYRVKGKQPHDLSLVPMIHDEVKRRVKGKSKAIDLKHHHKGYSTGWIHGHSVRLTQREPDPFVEGPWPGTGRRRLGIKSRRRLWEVLLRDLDGTERMIVKDKTSRKAAIEAAERLLRSR